MTTKPHHADPAEPVEVLRQDQSKVELEMNRAQLQSKWRVKAVDCGDGCVRVCVRDEDQGGKFWERNIFEGIRSCFGGKRLRLSAVWLDG